MRQRPRCDEKVIKEYALVKGSSDPNYTTSLPKKVQKYIDRGWQPFGAPLKVDS